MKEQRLNVGVAGLYFSNFEAVKHNVFPDSVQGLEIFSEEIGFDIFVYPELIGDEDTAAAANSFFKDKKVNFLLLQSSSLLMGDVIMPLADNDFRLGFWMVPEPEQGGEIQLNSMTGFNLGVSILRKKFPERKIKWFYGNTADSDSGTSTALLSAIISFFTVSTFPDAFAAVTDISAKKLLSGSFFNSIPSIRLSASESCVRLMNPGTASSTTAIRLCESRFEHVRALTVIPSLFLKSESAVFP